MECRVVVFDPTAEGPTRKGSTGSRLTSQVVSDTSLYDILRKSSVVARTVVSLPFAKGIVLELESGETGETGQSIVPPGIIYLVPSSRTLLEKLDSPGARIPVRWNGSKLICSEE